MSHEFNLETFLSSTEIKCDFSKARALPGGVVSDVIEVPSNRGLLAVKHTRVIGSYGELDPSQPFVPYDFESVLKPAPATHHLDYKILSKLSGQRLNVPKVLFYDQENRVTVMEHFGEKGYILLQDLHLAGEIPEVNYTYIGRSIAILTSAVEKLDTRDFAQVENSETQFQERLGELMFFYGRDRKHASKVSEIYSNAIDGKRLVPTDTHYKNMAMDKSGNIMHFDFGRTVQGSTDYPAPNFIGHLVLSIVGESQPLDQGIRNLRKFVTGFRDYRRIDETKFTQFAAAEALHRGGTPEPRWIDRKFFRDGIDPAVVCKRVHTLMVDVLKENEPSIDFMVNSLEKVRTEIN